jgi:hypothetical protein
MKRLAVASRRSSCCVSEDSSHPHGEAGRLKDHGVRRSRRPYGDGPICPVLPAEFAREPHLRANLPISYRFARDVRQLEDVVELAERPRASARSRTCRRRPWRCEVLLPPGVLLRRQRAALSWSTGSASLSSLILRIAARYSSHPTATSGARWNVFLLIVVVENRRADRAAWRPWRRTPASRRRRARCPPTSRGRSGSGRAATPPGTGRAGSAAAAWTDSRTSRQVSSNVNA